MAAPQTQAPAGQGQGQGQGHGRDQRRGRRPDFVQEEKQFDERTLHIDRVARVVKGGRRFRFRALVVVGDRKHRVGIGMAKGADVTAAVAKATDVAKKHFITVPLYKDTLPHEVESKVSGARILLKPASPGTGLIAGGAVRTILEVAGIKNALSKSLGSTNKANTAYATIAALESLVPAKNWITKQNQASKTVVPKTAAEKSVAKKTVTEKPVVAEKPVAAKKPAAKKVAKSKE